MSAIIFVLLDGPSHDDTSPFICVCNDLAHVVTNVGFVIFIPVANFSPTNLDTQFSFILSAIKLTRRELIARFYRIKRKWNLFLCGIFAAILGGTA